MWYRLNVDYGGKSRSVRYCSIGLFSVCRQSDPGPVSEARPTEACGEEPGRDLGVDPRANRHGVLESEWLAAWHAPRIPYRPPRPTESQQSVMMPAILYAAESTDTSLQHPGVTGRARRLPDAAERGGRGFRRRPSVPVPARTAGAGRHGVGTDTGPAPAQPRLPDRETSRETPVNRGRPWRTLADAQGAAQTYEAT